MNTAASLHEDLKHWIGGLPEREALLIEEAFIAESTLRATLNGRYNPGQRLEKALRLVMEKYPLEQGKAV